MKVVVRTWIYAFLRLLAFLRHRLGHSNGSVFLMPDIPTSNLGDQALLLGAMEGFKQAEHAKVTCIITGEHFPDSLKSTINAYGYDFVDGFQVLFASDSAVREKAKLYSLLARNDSIYLVGADVLDGQYGVEEATLKLNIMADAKRIGLSARIFGFSVSSELEGDIKDAFKSLSPSVETFARDQLSLDRVAKVRPCSLKADCAFLMPPCDPDSSINLRDFYRWRDESPKPVLGVCVRKHDFNDVHTRECLLEVLSQVCGQLDWRLAFIPHHPDDLKIQKELVDLCAGSFASELFVFDAMVLAHEVKAAVAECEHVLTSRMHVGIASLGMNTPITCIPYGGKFEGLLRHFGIESGIVKDDYWESKESFVDYLKQRLGDSSSLKVQVDSRLNDIRQLALENFK